MTAALYARPSLLRPIKGSYDHHDDYIIMKTTTAGDIAFGTLPYLAYFTPLVDIKERQRQRDGGGREREKGRERARARGNDCCHDSEIWRSRPVEILSRGFFFSGN